MVVVLSLSCLANILSFTLHYTSPSLYSCWPACALQFHGTSCSCCVASVVHDHVLWQCYCHALWGLSLTDVKKTTFFYGLILVPLQLTEWVLLISTIRIYSSSIEQQSPCGHLHNVNSSYIANKKTANTEYAFVYCLLSAAYSSMLPHCCAVEGRDKLSALCPLTLWMNLVT